MQPDLFNDIVTGILFVGLMLLALLTITIAYIIICIKQRMNVLCNKISHLGIFKCVKNKADFIIDVVFAIVYRTICFVKILINLRVEDIVKIPKSPEVNYEKIKCKLKRK